VIGHSFGGLLTQIIAGRGLSAASVHRPGPFRGVLPLPFSSLKSGSPVLGNQLNRHRTIPLTYDQFRYAFANAVSEDEAKVDVDNPERGPLLIIVGDKDHTVPPAVASASYKQYKDNPRRPALGDPRHRPG
jgi:non-heme chloroperoxidase